ncbi:hypothetical protein VNI00_017902 [Paramarasmius palmivorus]|uniref:Uncharacterized protein n=1 Tax=Paramarasmius palmivorus TaxID=297713 RepID=A0AAW0B1I6_9AGAR
MVYFTRSVARIIELYFPESTDGGLISGGLTLEELVYYRHLHESDELRNQDPAVNDEDFQDGLDEQNFEEGPLSGDSDYSDSARRYLAAPLRSFSRAGMAYFLYSDASMQTAHSEGQRHHSDTQPTGHLHGTGRRLQKNVPEEEAVSSWAGPVPSSVPYEKQVFIPSNGHASYLPRITDQRINSLPPSSLPSTGSARRNKRFLRSVNRMNLETEAYVAEAVFLDVTVDARASKPLWQGLNASADVRNTLKAELSAGRAIPNLAAIAYDGKETKITDSKRRVVIFRSVATPNLRKIMASICKEADSFILATTAPTAAERHRNLRGVGWFSIAGYDRNNKPIPKISRWHASQKIVVDRFFKKNSLFTQLTKIGCSMIRKVFPGIYKRFMDCSQWMEQNYGLKAPYGVFFNFCLNGVVDGYQRVHCQPHVDFKNVALGVCMLFVYGHFNHRERSWLVIWEAGVVVELPPGVFLLYPSSLFLHFNVDKHNFVVTEDEAPNGNNCKPLCSCDDPEAIHDENWAAGIGRGSIVWFNQATMFQTSELGYPTVKAARAAGVNTACSFPAEEAFEIVGAATHTTDPSKAGCREVDVVEDDQIDTVDRNW